jgi:phage shock protein A
MNILKRWTTTVSSSFDWMMNQVENHDALVTAAIREMQEAGAKAKMQLARVKKDGEQMRKRVVEVKEMVTVWEERAVRSNEKDRTKALECLRRKKRAAEEQKQIEKQLLEHETLEKQLIQDLRTIDERVNELKRKKNTFSARQYRAEALKAGQLSELGIIGEIDEIFERWDHKIVRYDSLAETHDDLDVEFEREEDRVALEIELEELVNK